MHLFKFLPAALALALATPFSLPAVGAPIELELSHQLDEERAERLEKLVALFNSRQKDSQFKLVRRSSGSAPSALNLVTREEQAQFVAAKREFKPLHLVMKEAGEAFDATQFAPELRVNLADSKGNLLALPLAWSTPVLFINKESFRKAGLDPEKPPKTWQEVQKAADKLFDAGSTCPYTTSWPAWVHIDNLSTWHGVPITDGKGRLAFNSLLQVKHLAQTTTWAKARYFIYFDRRDEADRRFAAGDCGMLTSSASVYALLDDKHKQNTGVSTLPYHDDQPEAPKQTLAGGSSLWVGGGRKPAEYQGVARFIRFITEPDIQVQISTSGGFLPMTAAARAAVGSRLLRNDVPQLQVAFGQLKGPVALTPFRVAEHDKIRVVVEEELEAAWAGRKSAKQALDDAVQRGNLLLTPVSAVGKQPAKRKK
ncbi:MAG TPA: extracellular solute-binding protein [Accumulibacter sp.]|nr:extracellular solute-binding protein [Accumulibacter sp.]